MIRMIGIMTTCAVVAGCGVSTDTVVRTGDRARSRILSSGVTLPISATNLYYAFQPQFADYLDTWISFSASPADCLSVARTLASAKTNNPALVPGTRSRFDNVTGGPGYHHPEYRSAHWDLGTVTHGTMFETDGLFVMVDTERNRIYISLRAP
jgi:hypothetical protein